MAGKVTNSNKVIIIITHTHTLAASYVSSTTREAGAAAEMAATRNSSCRPFSFAPFSADRSRDSGLHELFCEFLLPGFGPQNQLGLGGFTESVLSLPAYCSYHTTLQLCSVSRLFRCPWVPGRFRCLATLAFDLNCFELLTLAIFTTEGEKKINL